MDKTKTITDFMVLTCMTLPTLESLSFLARAAASSDYYLCMSFYLTTASLCLLLTYESSRLPGPNAATLLIFKVLLLL